MAKREAKKVVYTLLGDDGTQTVEDILSPFIRVMQINERRQPNYNRQKQPIYDTTTHPNEDNADFLKWLLIENHKRTRNAKPALDADKFAVEFVLLEHPEYKLRRGLRWKLKQTLARTA